MSTKRPPTPEELASVLWQDLAARGVTLYADGAQLRYLGSKGALTAAHRAAIAAHRPRLLRLARWVSRSPADCLAMPPCRVMAPCGQPVNGRPCLTPATCVDCIDPLPPGHRYRCPSCLAKPEEV